MNKTYAEYSDELTKLDYVCLGRYEHTFKKASLPVIYYWHNIKGERDVLVQVNTDEFGNAKDVVCVFNEQLL